MTTVLAPALQLTATRVLSRLRVALGTFVAVDAQAPSDATAQRGIDAAYAAVGRVQRLMHPVSGTDLGVLANSPPGTHLNIDPWTWEVLDLCSRLHRASRGCFDPCLSTAPGRFADLALRPPYGLTVRSRVHVDLGGIAKGYAVDRAVDALRAAGCSGGLVNAGGDVRVFGAKDYRIACGAAGANIVELRDGALATSDASHTHRPSEHRGYYHGLDRDLAVSGSVTIQAASAAVADGLTKCLLCSPGATQADVLRVFDARRIA